MTMYRSAGIVLLAALTFSWSALAQEHPTWTLNGGVLYVDGDGDRDLNEDATGFMLGVGRYFGPNFSLDLEYDSYDFELNGGGDVDVDALGLMGRFHFTNVNGDTIPYLGFGLGRADHDSRRGDGDNFMAQIAGGVHHSLSDRWALRAELRYRYDSDNDTGPALQKNFHDWMLTVGAQYALGTTGSSAARTSRSSSTTAATPDTPADQGPRDSDNDGVPDDRDQCPRTPAGVQVDAKGCPVDSDGDGVPDYRDDCPGTPAGTKVGPNGCEEELVIELPAVFFDFDKATLKPEGRAKLREVAATLQANDVVRVSVEGHTDWIGTEAYNQKLSEQRAKTVYDNLASQGVDESRMSWAGYGESRPVASNESDEGRARNRRVELRIVNP